MPLNSLRYLAPRQHRLCCAGFLPPGNLRRGSLRILLLYEAVRSRQYKQVLLVGVAWLVAAALHGAYSWQAGADRKFMVDWWVRYGGFPHSPPDSVADLLWYPEALLRFIYMAFKTPSFAGPEFNEALSDPAGLGLAIAFAVSLALAFIWRRSTGLLAAAAILLTLIASAFQIYPFPLVWYFFSCRSPFS